MKKSEYIKEHPKSMLAQSLISVSWPDNAKINIIGGLNTPFDKKSNLYKALQQSSKKEYVIGGHRQRGTEGWWMAVR